MSYENPVENEWVKPVMSDYIAECCDCGLKHEVDFKVVKVVEDNGGDTIKVEDVGAEYQVMLRARRVS